MRLLITGTGLLGREIGDAIGREHDLVWFDLAPPQELRGDVIAGDLSDYPMVRRAMNGVDRVVHTAALHGIHMESHTPSDFFRTNALGTFHVLEAARDAQVERVVVSSSTAATSGASFRPLREGMPGRITQDAEALPGDVYGLTKALGEDMLVYFRRKGVPAVALRYGAIRQLVTKVVGGDQMWWAANGMMTDVRDAVAANLAALFIDPLPERVAHTVLPTTLLDEAAIDEAGTFAEALQRRAPFLTDKHLAELRGRPVFLYDATTVEAELGITIAHGQDEYLRDAVDG